MADDKYTDNIVSKLRALEKGKKLDLLRDFSFEKLIGTGDHGSVYQVIDSKGSVFAVKVIETTAAHAEDCAAEIGLLDFLKNDSVVRLENWAYAKENKKRGYLLLIFEAAKEATVPMDAKQIVRIGVELAAAMEECHKTGLLHLNIKPSNILCFEDEIYRLSDFGMVHIGSSPNEFSAPEYSGGADFDHRADIYSLALSLYALLGGDAKDAPNLKGIDGYPDGLLTVLRCACANDPDDRYRFMREFGKALSSCLDGDLIETEQKGPVLDDEYLNDANDCFASSEEETSVIDKEAVEGLFEDDAEEKIETAENEESQQSDLPADDDTADLTEDESDDKDEIESELEDDSKDNLEHPDESGDNDTYDDTIIIGTDEDNEADAHDTETDDVIDLRDAVRCTKGRAVIDIIIIVLIALALLALPALLTLL